MPAGNEQTGPGGPPWAKPTLKLCLPLEIIQMKEKVMYDRLSGPTHQCGKPSYHKERNTPRKEDRYDDR